MKARLAKKICKRVDLRYLYMINKTPVATWSEIGPYSIQQLYDALIMRIKYYIKKKGKII